MKKRIAITILLFAVMGLGATGIRPYAIVFSSNTYELSPVSSISFRGNEYTQGVYFNGYNHNSNNKNPKVLYNLDNRFRDVVCSIAMNTNDNKDCNTSYVKFYLDGKLIKTVNMNEGKAIQTVIVPLNYRKQLQIELGCYAIVADIDFR